MKKEQTQLLRTSRRLKILRHEHHIQTQKPLSRADILGAGITLSVRTPSFLAPFDLPYTVKKIEVTVLFQRLMLDAKPIKCRLIEPIDLFLRQKYYLWQRSLVCISQLNVLFRFILLIHLVEFAIKKQYSLIEKGRKRRLQTKRIFKQEKTLFFYLRGKMER